MKPMTKKEQKAAEVAANKLHAYAKKVRALAGWVRVSDDEIKQAYDANFEAAAFAVEYACVTAVGRAIWPLKVAAVKAAGDNAGKTIDAMIAKLDASNWDLNVIAPRPARGDYSYLADAKRDARRRYEQVFKVEYKYDHMNNNAETCTVTRDQARELRFVTMAEEMAADQYNLFVCKMVNKIGAGAKSATLEGNHIWAHSLLTVTMNDGRVDIWKTQQIENRSKLGLWFPQWPSRIIKPKKGRA